MKAIFSDRWAAGALLLSLALFAALEMAATDAQDEEWARLSDCLSEPDRFAGRAVLLPSVRILGEGWVESDRLRVRVVGLPASRPGEYAHVLGRFEKEGHVTARRVDVVPGLRTLRLLMYGISAAVVLVLAFLALRRFRWSLHEGLFEARGRG